MPTPFTAAATALSLVLVAGCTSAKYDQDFADFDAQQSRTRSMLDAQIVKGAADDRRLSQAHFEGDELNALGRQKLERMIEGAGRADLKVYLDFTPPTPDDGDEMVLAVRDFLFDSGVRVSPETMDTMVLIGDPGRSYRSGDSVAAMSRLRGDASADAATPGLFGAQ